MFNQADAHDIEEGKSAYPGYRVIMCELADTYSTPLDRVTAAFVSLSPNSDYIGNLRSTITVLKGIKRGTPVDRITTSSYGHCRDRAYAYATGQADFLSKTKGLKILNFYHNIMDPEDSRWVTVDGHVCAAWRNDHTLTMKDALLKGVGEYREIKSAVQRLAFKEGLIPNQYQAILWMARKRILKVKWSPQMELFSLTAASLQPFRSKLDDPSISFEQKRAAGGRTASSEVLPCPRLFADTMSSD